MNELDAKDKKQLSIRQRKTGHLMMVMSLNSYENQNKNKKLLKNNTHKTRFPEAPNATEMTYSLPSRPLGINTMAFHCTLL